MRSWYRPVDPARTLPESVFDATVFADSALDKVLSDVGWKLEVKPLAQ